MRDPATAKAAQPETVALFISDLHLQQSMPRTTQAFFDFLQRYGKHTKQLYLLGDLFEYWAGDDDLSTPYHRQIADAIRMISDAGTAVFWIAGNRDFLAGEEFSRITGAILLPDPFIATIAGYRIVLTHGDAQCTDDTSYMAFRGQVRQQEWQKNFLAMPLAQRKAIIEGMRNNSRMAQSTNSHDIMDVTDNAVMSLFECTATSLMIHGHTHRPARHEYQNKNKNRIRYVLPDWDCDVTPPRGGWLAINAVGAIQRIKLDGTAAT